VQVGLCDTRKFLFVVKTKQLRIIARFVRKSKQTYIDTALHQEALEPFDACLDKRLEVVLTYRLTDELRFVNQRDKKEPDFRE
jgi:hypothetical protein